MKYYLSFDIGGTQIKFGILTAEGNIIEKSKIDTKNNGEQIINDIVTVKERLASQYNLQGVAFSMPGFVNVETGYLKTGGSIPDFYGINFKEIMQEKLGLPVELENDVNCVAFSEQWHGNAKDCDNFICITIGTGIGGALCLNGQISRGHSYMAGEFGYMLIHNIFSNVKNKSTCTLSATGSVKQGLISNYYEQKKIDKNKLSGVDIYQLADEGDLIASKVINEFYQSIAIGLYNLTFILNPEKILIGGAISNRTEIFPAIIREYQSIITEHPDLKGFAVKDLVSIESTHFKNESGLVGALYHFLQMRK